MYTTTSLRCITSYASVIVAASMVSTHPPSTDSVAQPQPHTYSSTPKVAVSKLIRSDRHRAQGPNEEVTARSYLVVRGDTLSLITERFYGSSAAWPRLYCAERSVVHDPNRIFPGEKLDLPYKLPKAGCVTVTITTTAHDRAYQAPPSQSSRSSSHESQDPPALAAQTGGTLGCSGLESLWVAAGGSRSNAFVAAEVAMAESGGRQYALSPTDDYGYWQINVSNGPAEATFDPIGNAHAAIVISHDGTNWSAWTTYRDGAYSGRC